MEITTKTEVNFDKIDKRDIFQTWCLISNLLEAVPNGEEVLEINPGTGEIVEEITKDELKQVYETLLKLVRLQHKNENLIVEIW